MGKVEFVLIGDVIKSRKKFKPKEWEEFHRSVESVNKSFKKSLKIPLTIYSGDSFGAVCKDVTSAIDVILALQQNQRPHKSRFVIIEDEISYGLESKSFSTLEGPALWKSGDLINSLKKSPYLFSAEVNNELLSVTLQSIINFILVIKSDWNELAWNIYEKYDEESTQKQVAEELNITQQYVSKTIKHSKLALVKEAESNLKAIIDGITNHIDKG